MLDVWVPTVHIENISLSTSKLPSEVDEHVEMKSKISVQLSRNDAFSSQSSKAVKHGPLGQVTALCESDEEVAGIANEAWHVLEVLWETNIIPQDTGHTLSYI